MGDEERKRKKIEFYSFQIQYCNEYDDDELKWKILASGYFFPR